MGKAAARASRTHLFPYSATYGDVFQAIGEIGGVGDPATVELVELLELLDPDGRLVRGRDGVRIVWDGT